MGPLASGLKHNHLPIDPNCRCINSRQGTSASDQRPCLATGEVNLLDDEAVTVGGTNHSHATADLQDAIAAGDYPEWTLCIQTMEIADEDKVPPVPPFLSSRTCLRTSCDARSHPCCLSCCCAGSVCAGRSQVLLGWYQLVSAPFVVQMMGEGFASNGGSMTRRLALAVSDGHHITVWSLTPLKSWHRSCCARIHKVLTGATAVSVLTVCPSGSGGDKEYFLLYAPSLHLGMFVPS